jgi:transposase
VGERAHGVEDWHARGRINVIGVLIGEALLTVGLFIIANIIADIFYAWVTQDLLPKLLPACVIVMDNAAFHKRQDIQTAITNAGHTLEYLSSYSPVFNDIEPKWAQAKAQKKAKIVPSSNSLPLMKFKPFYMGYNFIGSLVRRDIFLYWYASIAILGFAGTKNT